MTFISQGLEESDDGNHDHHLRYHRHNHHDYQRRSLAWSSGLIGVQWNRIILLRPKPQATGRPTCKSHGRGGSQPQPRGRGEPKPLEGGGGGGGIPWGGGGRGKGASSAAQYMHWFPGIHHPKTLETAA